MAKKIKALGLNYPTTSRFHSNDAAPNGYVVSKIYHKNLFYIYIYFFSLDHQNVSQVSCF